MPLDAICLRAVVAELSPQIVGSRIEKIQQPARDQVILLLRGNRRLLLCASPNQPRLHITSLLRDNPSQPPMFCMLLRKYLSGGRILSLEQSPLERVVTLRIEAADELGEVCVYSLILEAIGRHANLILCGADGRIIECLRRVDMEMSAQRQVLPGLYYHLPPRQERRDPLTVTKEEFLALLSRETPLDEWLVQTFTAISPLVAREIVYRAYGTVEQRQSDESLWDAFHAWQMSVMENRFTPILLSRDDKPMDFTYGAVTQYWGNVTTLECESFSSLLDGFYVQREQTERVKQKGQDLLKAASNAVNRVRRKLANQEKELAQTRDRDTLRLRGELITANLYRMERGMHKVTVENYYEEGCPNLDIPLDVRLSPRENAERYFKQYAKAKTAEKILTEQLAKGRSELTYLESVQQEITQAESEQDFNDIRAELTEGGYLRRSGGRKGGFQRPSKPREFRSSVGLRILVGRNNTQNDKLTHKTAQKWDIWFHTQKIHGSHVILCTEGGPADEQSIFEAAVLAAWFSQAREGKNVPVDYTPVKYVKRPPQSRPGMVLYTTYQTVHVTPDEALVKSLAVKP